MSRATCGVFAVDSHVVPEAFVREVLLYDRLLIPRPPQDEPAEWDRWVREGWDPARQQHLLAILGTDEEPASSGSTLAYAVDWNEEWRGAWREHWAHRQSGDSPFVATAHVLKVAVPAAFEALEAVVPYRSLEEFRSKVALRPRPQGQERLPGTSLVALIGREFLLPDIDGDDTSLREAVELACDPDFRAKRAAFHDWTRGFVRPLQNEAGASLVSFTDAASVRLAVAELRERVVAFERLMRRRRWSRVGYAMTAIGFVASGIGAVGDPVGLVEVFASIGGYVAGNLGVGREHAGEGSLAGAAMFFTAQRELGWRFAT
jgi:hypothetical protein